MADPEVNVLAIGDGACTVLQPWPERRPGPVAVLDCGVRRESQVDAADKLLSWLGGTLRHVHALVVSHFDLDHWGGLANLARVAQPANDLGDVPLYYPAMPRQVPAALLAMMGPITGTGSAALDLQAALDKVTGANTPPPTLRPLNDRSAPVRLAGERFHVLWPPSTIQPIELRAINNAVAAVNDLADDLAAAGHPELRDRLRRTNETTDLPDAEDGGHATDEDAYSLSGGQGESPDESDAEVESDVEADDWIPKTAEPLLAEIPQPFRDRYQKVLGKIRAANNNLSLVLAAESGRLIAFGDIGGPALRSLLRNYGRRRPGHLPAGPQRGRAALLLDSYDVLLVPHHGSHAYPNNMPFAKYCIAQSGRDHFQAWVKKHPPQRPSSPTSGSEPAGGWHAEKCWNTHVNNSFRAG